MSDVRETDRADERIRAAMDAWRVVVDARLATLGAGQPASLQPFAAAVDYALLSPGKRIRPVLAMAAAEACGVDPAAAVDVGCAFEMIHAYSLVHDDLPAMDDDDLRRGRPTSHVQYGEAVAILVGDALQAEAFRLVAVDDSLQATQRVDLIALLGEAAGLRGMVGGQYLDIAQDHDVDGLGALHDIHDRKTGALIAGAVVAGAIVGDAGEEDRARFTEFGRQLGWLFQLTDDVLDASGDTERIGKPVGSDERADKVTAVHVLGLDGARAEAASVCSACVETATALPGGGGLLPDIARFIASRDH